MEPNLDANVMVFDSCAAHFALSPEAQAEGARRRREDTVRNVAKEAAPEPKRVADEQDRGKK